MSAFASSRGEGLECGFWAVLAEQAVPTVAKRRF